MLLKLVPNKLKVWLIKQLYTDLASKGRMGDTRLAHVNDYEAKLLKSIGGSGTINPTTGLFEYGGGSGGGTTRSVTTNLPEYARPFYEELLKQTGKQTYTTDAQGNVTGVQEFTPYTGERVVGFTPQQQAVQQGVMSLQTPSQFGAATSTLGDVSTLGTATAARGLTGALDFTPGSTETLKMETPTNVPSFTYGGPETNPFTSAVTEQAIAEARRQAEADKSSAAMQSIGRGTFGSGREALLTAEGDARTRALIADLRAKGNQAAFENAQQQFERDRAANIQVAGQNLAAERERRKLEQQGGQFGAKLSADLGLGGLGTTLQTAQAQGQLGRNEQMANLERLRAQAATAGQQQALDQELANLRFQEFMEQQDFQRRLLEFQSNILRGQSGALGATQVQYAPRPSLATQIGGLGIAGLGLSRMI
tara:strand:- start:733 stop:2001 length:1269 start_codon:yes stop_codon:yes gene_type:complete